MRSSAVLAVCGRTLAFHDDTPVEVLRYRQGLFDKFDGAMDVRGQKYLRW